MSWRGAHTVTEAIYGAGFNSSGRFYANAAGALGMTPTSFRAGGDGASIRFAVGECSLGLDPRRRQRPGRVRDPARRRTGSAGARPAGPVSEARLIGGDAGFEKLVAHGGRLRRGARRSVSISRSTSAAPRSSTGSGRRFGRSRPGRRPRTPRSPGASARRRPCGPSRKRARRTRSRSPSRAIAWCGATGRCRATAGASSASAPCSTGRPCRDDGGRPDRGRWTGARDRRPTSTTRRARDRGVDAGARRVRRPRRRLRPGRRVPEADRDGAARLRAGRVQVLRLSASRRSSRSCGQRSIRLSPPSRTAGARPWAPPSASPAITPPSSSAAIGPGRPGLHRSCSSTGWATTTACTRTSTGSTSSRCRSPCCSRRRAGLHGRRIRAGRAAATPAVASRGGDARARATA